MWGWGVGVLLCFHTTAHLFFFWSIPYLQPAKKKTKKKKTKQRETVLLYVSKRPNNGGNQRHTVVMCWLAMCAFCIDTFNMNFKRYSLRLGPRLEFPAAPVYHWTVGCSSKIINNLTNSTGHINPALNTRDTNTSWRKPRQLSIINGPNVRINIQENNTSHQPGGSILFKQCCSLLALFALANTEAHNSGLSGYFEIYDSLHNYSYYIQHLKNPWPILGFIFSLPSVTLKMTVLK